MLKLLKFFSYQNLLEYGLYIVIFLLPLQTRWMFRLGELNGGYWEYGTMSLYLTDIALLMLLSIFVISGFYRKKIQNSEFRIQNFWWVIAGLELFVFISIFFAFDKWLALYGYGRFLLGIGLLFLVVQIKYDKIRLYWVIVVSGFLQSILAFWQFAMQQVYANKWLGMAMQNSSDLGVSVVDTGLRRWLRAYGSLPHPNMLGGFLVVCLLLNIILYFKLHQRWRKNTDESKERKDKIGLLISLLFFVMNFVGLMLTFSRGAWLGLFIGLLVPMFAKGEIGIPIFRFAKTSGFISLLGARRCKLGSLLNMSKFIFIIILVGGIFVWMFREPVMTRLNVGGRLENKSVQERVDYHKEAWQVIKGHWLFGVGMRNYGLTVADEVRKYQPAYTYQPVHNTFLLVWTEIGLLGLLIFVGLLIYSLFHCSIVPLLRYPPDTLRVRRRAGERKGHFALILAMIVMMLFDHWWWSLGFGLMLFWMILGLSISRSKS